MNERTEECSPFDLRKKVVMALESAGYHDLAKEARDGMKLQVFDKQKPGEVLTHVPQMSLRDWFAGQCYAVADAMMEARDD